MDERGVAMAMSPASERWLKDIAPKDSVPAAIRSLAIRATGSDDNAMKAMVPRVSGGWLRIHAIPLEAGGKKTANVIVEPARPAVLPETVANVYGFTPRECEVITWLARGLSSK